jgi:hypothetical protein
MHEPLQAETIRRQKATRTTHPRQAAIDNRTTDASSAVVQTRRNDVTDSALIARI